MCFKLITELEPLDEKLKPEMEVLLSQGQTSRQNGEIYMFMHYYTFDMHNDFVHYILVCRLFHSLNDLLVCVFFFYYSLQQYNVYYSINRPTDLPSVHLFGRPSGHSSVCPFVVSSCVRSFVRSFFVVSSCVRSFIGSFFVVRSFVCSSVRSILSFVVV